MEHKTMPERYLHNTCDTVDTGQYGARKKALSSEKERNKVFANFRKRTQHGYKLTQGLEK